jgi:uncharacterized flavoprotein (TIGR03862 family)
MALPSPRKIAIVGSGPCGLMAATEILSRPGAEVHLFERRPGLGRKLLVAGSSGLNISNGLPPAEFAREYRGWNLEFWSSLLGEFGPADWIRFIEKELGLETFLGTSDRYFVREMKASGLLKRWTNRLQETGAIFRTGHELSDFRAVEEGGYRLRLATPNGAVEEHFDRIVFALGGGSWEDEPPAWPEILKKQGVAVADFSPSNVGYEVRWSEEFLREAEGKPLKKIRFENARGRKDGELVITKYGLEGTPIYYYGEPGPAYIDLKPDLTLEQILERLERVKENLAPIRRVKQKLELGEASLALLFHETPPEIRADLRRLAERVKRFPVSLVRPRPLSEAISSRGGVLLSEIETTLELRRFPGVYCGGEMLDWDAPTGGFLIQAAVAMGYRIGRALSGPEGERR